MIITDTARFAALTEQVKEANFRSHRFGVVDDCTRCIDCEIGVWNGWKENCNA